MARLRWHSAVERISVLSAGIFLPLKAGKWRSSTWAEPRARFVAANDIYIHIIFSDCFVMGSSLWALGYAREARKVRFIHLLTPKEEHC